MRRRAARMLALLLSVAGSAASSGCGGDGTTAPAPAATATPPSGIVCIALAYNGPPLLSPAPGSTGVPVTLSVLTFGMLPIPDTITAIATLTAGDGSTITSGPLTPSFSTQTTTASIAGLQPRTTYRVTVTGSLNERGCNYAVVGNDGNFTTQ
jgi:hypothetical protein